MSIFRCSWQPWGKCLRLLKVRRHRLQQDTLQRMPLQEAGVHAAPQLVGAPAAAAVATTGWGRAPAAAAASAAAAAAATDRPQRVVQLVLWHCGTDVGEAAGVALAAALRREEEQADAAAGGRVHHRRIPRPLGPATPAAAAAAMISGRPIVAGHGTPAVAAVVSVPAPEAAMLLLGLLLLGRARQGAGRQARLLRRRSLRRAWQAVRRRRPRLLLRLCRRPLLLLLLLHGRRGAVPRERRPWGGAGTGNAPLGRNAAPARYGASPAGATPAGIADPGRKATLGRKSVADAPGGCRRDASAGESTAAAAAAATLEWNRPAPAPAAKAPARLLRRRRAQRPAIWTEHRPVRHPARRLLLLLPGKRRPLLRRALLRRPTLGQEPLLLGRASDPRRRRPLLRRHERLLLLLWRLWGPLC